MKAECLSECLSVLSEYLQGYKRKLWIDERRVMTSEKLQFLHKKIPKVMEASLFNFHKFVDYISVSIHTFTTEWLTGEISGDLHFTAPSSGDCVNASLLHALVLLNQKRFQAFVWKGLLEMKRLWCYECTSLMYQTQHHTSRLTQQIRIKLSELTRFIYLNPKNVDS